MEQGVIDFTKETQRPEAGPCGPNCGKGAGQFPLRTLYQQGRSPELPIQRQRRVAVTDLAF